MDQFRQLDNYITNYNIEDADNLIKSIDITKIATKKINSFISLCLRYYYLIEDYDEINRLMSSDFKFMKRDYLLYCKYLYKYELSKAKIVFKNNIILNQKLLTKDIDFLIENKCFELIKLLDGYYINCSNKSNISNFSVLKRFNNIINYLKIINHFKSKIPEKSYDIFIKSLVSRNVIIDGGNVIYSNKNNKLKSLENIFDMIIKKYNNPLIVIHCRHFKDEEGKKIYSKYKKNIFKTPYNVYDDYYIITGMLINKIPVVSNDNFRDHIFDMFKLFDSKNNQIANYIKENIISYNSSKFFDIKKYSNCIQYDDKYIYIPSSDGFYVI